MEPVTSKPNEMVVGILDFFQKHGAGGAALRRFPAKEKVLDGVMQCALAHMEKAPEANVCVNNPQDLARRLPLFTWSTRSLVRLLSPICLSSNTEDLVVKLQSIVTCSLPLLRKELTQKGPFFAGLKPFHKELESVLRHEIDDLRQKKPRLRSVHGSNSSESSKNPEFLAMKERVWSILEKYLQKNVDRWAALPERPVAAKGCCDCTCDCGEMCASGVLINQSAHFEVASNPHELYLKLKHVNEQTIPKLQERYAPIASSQPFLSSLEHTAMVVKDLMDEVQAKDTRDTSSTRMTRSMTRHHV